MAQAAALARKKEFPWIWEGTDRKGNRLKGRSLAVSENEVRAELRRQGVGERWARPWLDLVRFAESDGFKADVFRPRAWRYRDYVIQSLNADKPYDRLLQEQLAGDELFPDDLQARVATGYLRLWPLEDNQKDVQRQWSLILDDITEVTAEAFLGLGLKCAKCHDHKYDPIPQADYFRMQAFFAALLPRFRQALGLPAEAEALLLIEVDGEKDNLPSQAERIKKLCLEQRASARCSRGPTVRH